MLKKLGVFFIIVGLVLSTFTYVSAKPKEEKLDWKEFKETQKVVFEVYKKDKAKAKELKEYKKYVKLFKENPELLVEYLTQADAFDPEKL